jgi:quercetin dioxygenase-like cupin family protein
MQVKRYDEVTPTTYDGGRSGVTMREMITAADGAPTFAMRVFDLAPGATTPYHHHPWEHEVVIVNISRNEWIAASGRWSGALTIA